MKARLIFFAMLFLTLFGCKKTDNPEQESGLIFKTITVNNIQREYAVYIPENLQPGLPVVFCLHGGGGTIEGITGISRYKSPYKLWMDVAESDGAIIVYPQALEKIEDRPNWNDCREDCGVCPASDDVTFLVTLLDTIIRQYGADSTNVFFCGVSNGGFMTLRMATEVPDRLKAIGVIIASLPDTSDCSPREPQQPIPVMFVNGTEDPMLPYEGGTIGNPPDPTHGTCKPVEYTVDYFVNLNGCDTVPDVYQFPDIDKSDSSYVIKYAYHSQTGADVWFYKVVGGGHAAPSIAEQYSLLWESYVGKQNHDMETVTEMWNFFKQYIR